MGRHNAGGRLACPIIVTLGGLAIETCSLAVGSAHDPAGSSPGYGGHLPSG